MCELGQKLKNVGKRSKARLKLPRKRGISETKPKSGQGQGQGGERGILSRPGILHRVPEGPRTKKKKERRKEKFAP